MSKKRRAFTYLCIVAMAAVFLVSIKAYMQSKHDEAIASVGVPFEILDESKYQSLSVPIWRKAIFLSKEYYSKENLARLFRYFSKQYPSKQEELDLTVYTSKKNFERDRKRPAAPGNVYPSSNKKWIWIAFHDASFFRLTFRGTTNHVNEWYTYRPDLDNPDKFETVVIKGRAPSGKEELIETWETSNNAIKIRVEAYEMKGVEPQGTYYTYESINSNYYLLDSRIIMIFRHDNQVAIPRDNIRFVNDKIGYIFMGWMYAVTTDGGNIWSVWDAETDLPSWQCCNYDLIQDVQVNKDGVGTMKLNMQGGILELHTKDYGKHWSMN